MTGGRGPRVPALPSGHVCGTCAVRLDNFCGALKAKELARFKALGSIARARPGQCLFHEGDAAELVFNVTRGTLKLYRLLPDGRRQIASFVAPGDFLGLTREEVHAYTAEALEPVEVCRFPRARFERFAEAHPEIGGELYAIAAHALRAAREQIVLLGRKRAIERVASFLLARSDRSRDPDPGIVRLPMTRTDIADHLGLTKETVSRTFSELRRRGLIALRPGGGVELLGRERLHRIASGACG